jgi:hypothetical protein
VRHVHFFVALTYLYTFTDIAGQTLAPFMIKASIILSRTLAKVDMKHRRAERQ